MASLSAKTSWIYSAPETMRTGMPARLRLFCFPHAGGGASGYLPWLRSFGGDIDVCIVQLPGRENRLPERPFTEFAALVETLAEALHPYFTLPFVFFGHSMGALLSFGLAQHLRERGLPLPVHLFLSAYRAPQLPLKEPQLHSLPEAELVNTLLSMNGTQREVLENEELRQLFLPLLRADFSVCETYVHKNQAPLSCPITIFGGLRDNRVSRAELEGWRELTDDRFKLLMFPGDHFYIHGQREALTQIIMQEITARSK